MDFDSLVDDSQKQKSNSQAAKPVMFDDLKDDSLSKPSANEFNKDIAPKKIDNTNIVPQTASLAAPKFDDLVDDSEAQVGKHETLPQQVEAGVEGLARGLTGGLSDALAVGMRKGAAALGVPEDKLHYIAPSPTEMRARKEENPFISGGAELAGNVAILSKLPQVGGKAIDGMIKMGLISGGDELSKAMLGEGDPLPAVASHIAGSAGVGLLLGGVLGKVDKLAEKSFKALAAEKVGNKIPSFLSGVGHAASFPGEAVVGLEKSALTPAEAKLMSDAAFKQGQAFFKGIGNKISNMVSGVGATVGYKVAGEPGIYLGPVAAKALEKMFGPTVSKATQKIVAPAVLKAAASGDVKNLAQIIDHADVMAKGAQKITKGVANVFDASANKAIEHVVNEKSREKLKKYIEEGGIDQALEHELDPNMPAYAEGGKVAQPKSNQIAEIWPEQQMMLSAAKGRVSNYLKSQRPVKNLSKLAFDSYAPMKQKEKSYNKLLDLAAEPLSILNHIKDGTLQPSQMKDFTSMYPDLHQHLSNKITEHITKHQMGDSKKPPYKVRQALSLFLGTNLDSSITPMGIQTAQMVFAKQKAAQGGPPKASFTALSKIGKNYQTADQARTQRLNKD